MNEIYPLVYGLAGLALLYLASRLAKTSAPNLDHIPTIGPSGLLTSYLGAFRFIHDSERMTEEGYRKYPNGLFKIAKFDKWLIFCCGQQFIEDFRKASDAELSNNEALRDELRAKYTMGDEIFQDMYHVAVIRGTLTRNLGICFPDIHDEIVQSFEDILSLGGNEWKAVPAMNTILDIVCRTSNRLFVGLPLCRKPDFIELSKQFTADTIMNSAIINLSPAPLRSIVGRCITTLPAHIKRASKHLSPIIEERMRKAEVYGRDWPNKPNDALTWLLDHAQGSRRTHRGVILRILMMNTAATHTSSVSFLHALCHLAANPEYAAPLREEVESCVKKDGWTKSALDRMFKVDSFLKESQRLDGLGSVVMFRKVLKDFTCSDGTVLPAGAFVAVPLTALHHDEANYTNAKTFDPFRFARLKDPNSEDIKLQMVTASPDFLAWGLGKHTCPGRYFATLELKTMLAHIVVSYDVKMKIEGSRPRIADRNVEVLFRRRSSL